MVEGLKSTLVWLFVDAKRRSRYLFWVVVACALLLERQPRVFGFVGVVATLVMVIDHARAVWRRDENGSLDRYREVQRRRQRANPEKYRLSLEELPHKQPRAWRCCESGCEKCGG